MLLENQCIYTFGLWHFIIKVFTDFLLKVACLPFLTLSVSMRHIHWTFSFYLLHFWTTHLFLYLIVSDFLKYIFQFVNFLLDVTNIPRWCSGKEFACQCRRCQRWEFDLWVGKIPWRRIWQPTPVFLPGESRGQRSVAGHSAPGCKELDRTERAHTHNMLFSLSSEILMNTISISRHFFTNLPIHFHGVLFFHDVFKSS